MDPLFVNAVDHDFHLLAGSRMIDAGTFLTYTKGQGSGQELPVEDVKYFYSGFGIDGETGDEIQLSGQSQTARILTIDYSSNVLTLDKSLTWTDSVGVSLGYSGNAPDLGAFEYGSTAIHDTQCNNNRNDRGAFIAAYPNLINDRIHITFGLSQTENVQFSLFTVQGKLVKTFHPGKKTSGIHSIQWDVNTPGTAPIPSGIYIIRLRGKTSQARTRLVYIR